MSQPSPHLTLQLSPGQLMHLPLSRTTTLEVVHGRIWITRSGDLQDHFLHAGDRLQLLPGSGTLLGAETEAALAVAGPAGRPWPARLLNRITGLFTRAAAAAGPAPAPAG
ncbi:DUF2917 domain-containing protein [Eleftheria terrae]|uniref:DUF2917 domain-containing protein n=1 Tax=Eleftheria terrae TaxID=1597781 RepID=UPI00263BA368|nr:DUF2917 domain-containing protein [Eleftheria terrae]WKB51382.1 DUF2917 domain-containing protein [Eleftheria terrae]